MTDDEWGSTPEELGLAEPAVLGCACRRDRSGLIEEPCAAHEPPWQIVAASRDALDAELDAVVMAGNIKYDKTHRPEPLPNFAVKRT